MTLNILDERAADKEVIASLIRELNRRDPMNVLFKLEDGTVIRVHGGFEIVEADELKDIAARLRKDLEHVESLVSSTEAPVDTPAEPVSSDPAQNDAAPVSEPQPQAAPEAAAEAQPVPEPAAEAPAPVEQAVENPPIDLQ